MGRTWHVRTILVVVAALIGVVLWPRALRAGGEGAVTLSQATFADGPAKVGHLWRFHAGDDPRWAAPTFDDSGWPLLDPALPDSKPPDGFEGKGWYRLRVSLAEDLDPQRFAFQLRAVLPCELYLDGERIISFDERPELGVIPAPRELFLGSRSSHLLAIRVVSSRWQELAAGGLPNSVQVEAVPLRGFGAARAHRSTLLVQGVHGLLFGAALSLGVMHLLMFLAYRDDRKNLYFAGLTFSFVAVFVHGAFSVYAFETVEAFMPFIHVFKLALAWFGISAIVTFRTLLSQDNERIRHGLWLIGVVLSVAAPFLPQQVYLAVMGLGMIECGRLVIMGLVRRNSRARGLAVGSAIFVGANVITVARDLESTNLDIPLAPGVGVLALLVSISATLAIEFATAKRAEVEKAQLHAQQAKLVHAEKMAALGVMVAGIAHEMNTPLGAVRSAGDSLTVANERLRKWLEKNAPDGKDDKRLVKTLTVATDSAAIVGSAVQRLSDVVQRLRSFAKLDEAAKQRCDPNECVETTLAMLGHALDGVSVSTSLGAMPELSCVPRQINQVLTNVLLNAIEAGATNIGVTTREEGSHAVIEIRDDGSGVASDVLPKIFDPGFTTKGVGVGGGLGLAICHQIVSDHEGTIGLVSEDDTVVTIRLPA